MKGYKLILAILGLMSCQAPQNNKINTPNAIDTVLTKGEFNLDGYWILSNYIDSILYDKAIAKHAIYGITDGAITFNIVKDSLNSMGLMYVNTKLKIALDSDTLGTIDSYGEYRLIYNSEQDCIRAIDISKGGFKEKVLFLYRKVTESRLKEILKANDPFKIRDGLYQYFLDSLISDDYQQITKNGILKDLALNPDGSMNGFRKYNKYSIHDYFGTQHPYQNYDAIIFEDSTFTHSKHGPPPREQINQFNWTFKGDTLLLIELLTDNYEEYYLGKEKYKFIKTNKNSH